MGEPAVQVPVMIPDDELEARRERRDQLLLQRERAALLRRRRGFTVRLPSAQPMVLGDSARRRVL